MQKKNHIVLTIKHVPQVPNSAPATQIRVRLRTFCTNFYLFFSEIYLYSPKTETDEGDVRNNCYT